MKSFTHYLTESARTYSYTIKILGEPEKEFLDKFTTALKKFDPEKIEAATTTPIQKDPFGFPGAKNANVTIIKVEFKYPATEPMIRQIARLHGCDENRVRVVETDFNDSMTQEAAKYAAQESPVLTDEQLEDSGKQASKEYSEQYLNRVVPKEPTFDYTFAGKETPVVKPKEEKMGIKSPFSSVSRVAKPATNSTRP
jgi:hypothetical protein